MTKEAIAKYLEDYAPRCERTLAIVDFGNVEKWKNSLGWNVGIKQLAKLVKHFAKGKQDNRRFYYGSDYGPSEKSQRLSDWSRMVLEKAQWNAFAIVTKRVKYMHKYGTQEFEKKCDLDVEMVVDAIRLRDNYDTLVLFSGDGDLMCGARYLSETYGKKCIVIGARDHIGREVFDAKSDGHAEDILYAQDFEYRLKETGR